MIANSGLKRRLATGFSLIAGVAIGLGVGVAGHDRLGHLLGLHEHEEIPALPPSRRTSSGPAACTRR